MDNSKNITHSGETLTITEWSERMGIEPEAIRKRIEKGTPVDDMVKPNDGTEPIDTDAVRARMAKGVIMSPMIFTLKE